MYAQRTEKGSAVQSGAQSVRRAVGVGPIIKNGKPGRPLRTRPVANERTNRHKQTHTHTAANGSFYALVPPRTRWCNNHFASGMCPCVRDAGSPHIHNTRDCLLASHIRPPVPPGDLRFASAGPGKGGWPDAHAHVNYQLHPRPEEASRKRNYGTCKFNLLLFCLAKN